MENCIEHFSHEHPLRLFQVGDNENPKPHHCTICGLPILSSPSYTCSIDSPNCNFFLHKPCATQESMPKKMFHRLHNDTLRLRSAGDSSGSFMYRCRNYSRCKFQVHPLVAKPVEIETKHVSHEAHPLVAFCKEIVCVCSGCGEEEKGFFFYCQNQECNFWIHQKCSVLPSVVKLPHHDHPYILAYSLRCIPSYNDDEYDDDDDNDDDDDDEDDDDDNDDGVKLYENCSICGKPWRFPKSGVYLCGECWSLVHVACAKSTMDDLNIPETEFMLLPDEEGDRFPSLAIRRFVERNNQHNMIIKQHHQHPLIPATSSHDQNSDNICHVCTQPLHISSPSYSCQLLDCPFTAHEICANHLPTSFPSYYGKKKAYEVVHDQMKSYNSVFTCVICARPSNGSRYSISDNDDVTFDLECAVVPKIIKHSAHEQHLLFQTSVEVAETSIPRCCSLNPPPYIYRCVVCDFCIHTRCALLPKTTRHKFDHHPLKLIMTGHDHDHKTDHHQLFCEFCEEEIELKLWYYGCHKCEHYFHINCIPSVGHMSKINFEKTHVYHQLHQHPLTLTRMLTHGFNERCGVCNGIIRGFAADEMAFHCSPCLFWVHFSCASANTNGLLVYYN